MADHNRVLSIKEFCEHYGICLATAYTHIRNGKLRARKLGRRTILLASDVDAFVAGLPEFHACGREQSGQGRLGEHSKLTAFGRTQTVFQWAKEFNINSTTLKERLKRGWDAEKALSKAPARIGRGASHPDSQEQVSGPFGLPARPAEQAP